MAKGNKGLAPTDVQHRDVFETQRRDRSVIQPAESKTWRIVLAIVGAVFAMMLTYCVVSIGMGVGDMVNDFMGRSSGPAYSASDDESYVDSEDYVSSDGDESYADTQRYAYNDGKIAFTSDAWLDFVLWYNGEGYGEVGGVYKKPDGTVTPLEELVELYGEDTGDYSWRLVQDESQVNESVSSEGSADVESTVPVEGESSVSEVESVESESPDEVIAEPEVGVETNPWAKHFYPNMYNVCISLLVGLICWAGFHQVLMRNWEAQNALNNVTDINQYDNDQHIATPIEVQEKFDIFPDIGAHSSVQVSSLISHMMLSNKGLANIQVAKRYEKDVLDENGDVEFYTGELIEDDDGNYSYESVPMIDEKLGKAFFKSAGVPSEFHTFYDARKIKYNPGNENREKLKGYDTVADLINKDWELPEYEPQRPAGAYVVDTAPVNTMILAITRAGKG